MAIDEHIEQIFLIKCKGRGFKGEEFLSEPVSVEVKIYQRLGDEKNISSVVGCPYNIGSHGQRCKASHPAFDKVAGEFICPYSICVGI